MRGFKFIFPSKPYTKKYYTNYIISTHLLSLSPEKVVKLLMAQESKRGGKTQKGKYAFPNLTVGKETFRRVLSDPITPLRPPLPPDTSTSAPESPTRVDLNVAAPHAARASPTYLGSCHFVACARACGCACACLCVLRACDCVVVRLLCVCARGLWARAEISCFCCARIWQVALQVGRRVQELEKANKQLVAEAQELERANQKLEAALAKSSKAVATLETKAGNLQKELRTANQEKKRLEKDLEQKMESSDDDQDLHTEIQQLHKDKKGLERKVTKLEKKVVELEEHVEELEEQEKDAQPSGMSRGTCIHCTRNTHAHHHHHHHRKQ